MLVKFEVRNFNRVGTNSI